jgi:hypothetical protein
VEIMVDIIKADGIVKHCGAMVVGGVYDIHSGAVKWL